ncbi:MAG: hypothetical protein JXB03_13485 [Spirochaetales bacterium]|nr:hypothetical protein [Spirochaetales bacterium]
MDNDGHKGPLRPPNCLACVHFKVTWDPDFPRGCSLFGVKSKQLPSASVYASTGRHCPSFRRKKGVL